MKIRHAILEAVLGSAIKSNGMTIVPVAIRLDGNGFSSEFALEKQPAHRIPPILRVPIEKQYDVSWVCARIPRVFGLTPEKSENEKTLLEEGFIAFPDQQLEGIPFICSDYYGRTALRFSPHEKDQSLKAQAAAAFWDALLEKPEDLADFEERVMHMGAPVWLNFGCKDCEPYFFESPDEDEGE